MADNSPLNNVFGSHQFRRFMKQLAVMGGALLLVGLVLKLAGVQYNNALLIVGFGTLAIVAFLLGKLFPADPAAPLAPIRNFSMTITGYSVATALLGLLFVFMHWPGARTMLYLALIALAICAIAWLYYFLRRNK